MVASGGTSSEPSQVNIGALGIGSEIKHKAPTVCLHTLNLRGLHAQCSRKSDVSRSIFSLEQEISLNGKL